MKKENFAEDKRYPGRVMAHLLGNTFNRQDRKKGRVRVLCLGHTGEELEKVYFQAGIPEKAITSITNEEDVGQIFRQNYPYANCRVIDLLDFLQTTKSKFEVIHLDFYGNLSRNPRACIETVFERELLTNEAVFATTVYGSRERSEVQAVYNENLIIPQVAQLLADMASKNILPDPETLKKLEKRIVETGVKDKRSDAITLFSLFSAHRMDQLEQPEPVGAQQLTWLGASKLYWLNFDRLLVLCPNGPEVKEMFDKERVELTSLMTRLVFSKSYLHKAVQRFAYKSGRASMYVDIFLFNRKALLAFRTKWKDYLDEYYKVTARYMNLYSDPGALTDARLYPLIFPFEFKRGSVRINRLAMKKFIEFLMECLEFECDEVESCYPLPPRKVRGDPKKEKELNQKVSLIEE